MRIAIGGERRDDTTLDKHGSLERKSLRDGDVLLLSTYTDIIVACTVWGDASC